jgi:hypothetical protein
MRATDAPATVRALIAAIPNDRLRDLFLELVLASLLPSAPKPAQTAAPQARGRPPKTATATPAANQDAVERRQERRAATPPPPATANGRNGQAAAAITPQAFWEHAEKLERKRRGAP